MNTADHHSRFALQHNRMHHTLCRPSLPLPPRPPAQTCASACSFLGRRSPAQHVVQALPSPSATCTKCAGACPFFPGKRPPAQKVVQALPFPRHRPPITDFGALLSCVFLRGHRDCAASRAMRVGLLLDRGLPGTRLHNSCSGEWCFLLGKRGPAQKVVQVPPSATDPVTDFRAPR